MIASNLGLIRGIISCHESEFPGNHAAEIWGHALRIHTFGGVKKSRFDRGKKNQTVVCLYHRSPLGWDRPAELPKTEAKSWDFLYGSDTVGELLQGRTHERR